MKTNKKYILLSVLFLLAASCNPLKKPLPDGVVKTVNGGTDWQFANTIASSTTGSLATLDISKLAFDPQNRQNVFAGSYTGGLYESTDAAADWKNILSNIYVYDLAISPQDSKTIYAAGLYASHGRVLKTSDGGGSWVQIYNEENAADPVRAIAINPANSSQLVLGTSTGNLVKTSDGGQTWQLVNSFSDQINRIFWQGGSIYVLLKTKGLYAVNSTATSTNFSELTASLRKSLSSNGYAFTASAVSSFSQAFVDTVSQSLIYITTDKGLYKTTDGGAHWTLVNLPVKLGAQVTARAIAVAQSSSNIVMASVGSTIYKSADGGLSWQTQGLTTAGFINYILIDPQLPQIVYAGIYSTQ
ncbi:MAG: hypothetical protein P4L74_00860 [Candidatus Doudnabacteria bacterium]|nr:hypothetical protein [Candidatus Doudnabacteria bacterium]